MSEPPSRTQAEAIRRGSAALGWAAQLRGALWASIVGCTALWTAFAISFDSPASWAASIDFNGELFADLLGPYWRTAESLAEGSDVPDPQYLYPATLACLLAPLTALGPTGASWIGVGMGALSVGLLMAVALLLIGPRRAWQGAALGPVLFLAFPVVHGVYWANAGPLALGAGALGWCLAARGREGAGGVLIGLGAAIKLLPALLIVGLVMHGRRRAAWTAAGAAFAAGVLFPVAVMGPGGFLEFHRVALQGLGDMASSCRTPLGGRGSQDIVAVSARLAGTAAPWWGYVAGGAASIWALSMGFRRRPYSQVGAPAAASTAQAMAPALLWLLAAPGLFISPTWAHGLAWLPLAWWWTASRLGRSGVGWAALLSSMAAASLPTAWLVGDPTLYLISAAPLAASLLALVALFVADAPCKSRHIR